MGKQVLRYRTCDKCPGEVRAAVTDKVSFNGSRYDLDLCEKHSLQLFSAMMVWLDVGTKVGESKFEQQAIARDVMYDLELPKPRTTTSVESADLDESLDEEPVAPVTPLHKVLAGDPSLPLTASRWKLTPHAKDQMRERGFTLAEVLWAAERPELALPCKPAEDGRDRSGNEERTKGGCTAVVDPITHHVITVLYASGVERDETREEAEG